MELRLKRTASGDVNNRQKLKLIYNDRNVKDAPDDRENNKSRSQIARATIFFDCGFEVSVGLKNSYVSVC